MNQRLARIARGIMGAYAVRWKVIRHATAEEIDHAVNRLESQAKKMSDRAGGIRRNAHKIFA